MRILYVSDNSSEHNRQFLVKLVVAGHDVFFLDICSERLPEGWLPLGVSHIRHKRTLPRNLCPESVKSILPEFEHSLDDRRPDLVHAGPVPTCGYLSALAGFRPSVLMSWGSDLLVDSRRSAECGAATQFALRNCDGFVCDCATVKQAALDHVDLAEWQIAQFPWGVSPGVFSPGGQLPPATELPFGTETIRLICTRSWEQLYRIDILLEAFKMAFNVEQRLRLILLGDGSERWRVHDFINQNSLSGAVLTPGRISPSELPKWFRAANGYVSCAASDGTSVSLLEALATGLPVVITDVPSNREWVKEDENGWLATSAESFTRAMLRVSTLTPAKRRAISITNRRIVAERANWDQNFPRLLDLYHRVVHAHKAVPA